MAPTPANTTGSLCTLFMHLHHHIVLSLPIYLGLPLLVSIQDNAEKHVAKSTVKTRFANIIHTYLL